MPQTVEEILELPQILALVRRHLTSPLGAAELETLRPLPSQPQAEDELSNVHEAMGYLGSDPPPSISFHGLCDVRPAVAKLSIEGVALDPLDLLHLLDLLERAGDLRSTLAASRPRFPRLARLADSIADFRPLLRDLAGKILPDGRLDDHASVALRRIRRDIEHQKRAVHDSLERFLRAHSEEGSLQEDYITIRNDRLVVPVKAGEKRRIEGVIHAASSSGQTLFVEPLETIDLNNHLVRLAEEELREIHRILREMTARLAHYAADIAAAVSTLARLELLFARARFGLEFRASIPRFAPANAPRLHLRRARHPLLEDLLRRRGESSVPASLTMDPDHRVLIITGPNTGGKTVALKTVGLLALMAQTALPVPAEEAEFPWFDQILADIGDSQSIQDSLSTFSSHIIAIRAMIDGATGRSLVLLDEMGAATDPQEGGALAVAVVDHFRQAGAFTLVSTHLPALKIHGVNTPGVLSASVGFNEQTLEPNYQLSVGLPGKSAGLDIARRLGLPATVIDSARRNLTTQDREVASLITELHRRVEEHHAAEQALEDRRRELERREKETRVEWEKRQAAKLQELDRRVNQVLEKFNAEAKQTLASLPEIGRKAARRPAELVRQLREEFDATVLETYDQAQARPRPAEVTPGVLVRLRDITTPARVRRLLSAGKLEVESGPMKMQVALEDVLEVLPSAPPLPKGVTLKVAPSREASLTEINVIGSTAEEARDRVDKFLDSAVLSLTPRVRIVHGHGMGVLRRTLWEMLASHPHVEKFYHPDQREGGSGATIVELKT